MGRIAILIEVDEDDEGFRNIDFLKIKEVRSYEMHDHEQCAIQFVREMVMQGRTPDPDREAIVVIGGDVTTMALEGTKNPIPVDRVPHTVWAAVPPQEPMWRAMKL